MSSIGRRRIRLGPELNKMRDFAVPHGEERDCFCRLKTIGDRDLRHGFDFCANDAMNCELPEPVTGVLDIHLSEAFGAANAFIGLRPIKDELGRKNSSD